MVAPRSLNISLQLIVPRKSSDFILLWDNLLIPEDIMLAIPLFVKAKFG
jgi:hypothetical protein